MVGLNSKIRIIMLSLNCLSISIKKKDFIMILKIQDPVTFYLQETHFLIYGCRFKVKEWKSIHCVKLTRKIH